MTNLTVTLHQRGDNGWQEIATHYADSARWSKIDRMWIEELLSRGFDSLTTGDVIYELNQKYKPTEDHKAIMRKGLADDYTTSQQKGWTTE